MWLISFKAQDMGWVQINGFRELQYEFQKDRMTIIREHPATFVSRHKHDVRRCKTHDAELATDILLIYSAIRIPDDLLNDEQIDLLLK